MCLWYDVILPKARLQTTLGKRPFVITIRIFFKAASSDLKYLTDASKEPSYNQSVFFFVNAAFHPPAQKRYFSQQKINLLEAR